VKNPEYISIAVMAPLEHELSYAVPPELRDQIKSGQRISVPLGRRKAVGVVLREESVLPSVPCKPIDSILEQEPSFTPLQMEFLQWASQYYLTPLGEMLRTALPAGLTHVKASVRRRLKISKGEKKSSTFENRSSTLTLTSSQQKVVEAISRPSQENAFGVHLIHGVTGSGKTEIYFSVIQELLKKGKQAICLVPEISLTPQTLDRYAQHFPLQVLAYHSGLSEGERVAAWEACAKGDVSILIGTRSALFAPFRNLGLIVVDEEQDSSYKQEERTRYHARDLSIVRGKIENIPVILGSATPSVETYFKAKNGKFFYHELSERYGKAELPKVEVVDLRVDTTKAPLLCKEGLGEVDLKDTGDLTHPASPYKGEEFKGKKFSLFSPRLLEEIAANLDRKEQTLIFLNRRGFSHFLLCEDCGHTPACPNCDITLTYHRKSQKLICHYCDHQIRPPELCERCHGSDWRSMGSGTERIEEELLERFPSARIGRMDRDTTSRKGTHQTILKKLAEREIDVLVGTQMIAKGHDYPYVTLVGVLLADTSLHIPDFRAAESTYQLITQVAGRAGRSERPGRVLLQTFSPEHYGIEAASAHRVLEFYNEELKAREELGYPPFQRLLVLRVQGTQGAKVRQGAEELRRRLESLKSKRAMEFDILGPSPCLVEKLRNYYRWQILLKCPIGRSIQPLLRAEILDSQNDWLPRGLRLIVDVDPVSVI
jgi:primosomal protein N' (replication factor Y)